MRHRRFHADEDVVKGDGLDPSLEHHVDLVCFVWPEYLECIVSLFKSTAYLGKV